MLLTRASQVAMRASLSLALDPEAGPRRVRDLAEEVGVATTYMAKVLQGLARAGLVKGVRGPGGGVQLARPASRIRPWDVVEAVQSVQTIEACILSSEPCGETKLCALHDVWTPVREHVVAVLRTPSLLELARGDRSSGAEPGAPARFGETV